MVAILILSSQASLAIVEIATYSLTFFVSAFACLYNGFSSEKLGFVFLLLFCSVHIIGSACYLNYELNSASSSFGVVYATTSFISVAPLLSAALCFLRGAIARPQGKGVTSVPFNLLHIMPLAGLAMGIAGGVEAGQSDALSQGTGQSLLQGASVIYIATAAAILAIESFHMAVNTTLRTLAVSVAMIFLVISIVYDVLTAFAMTGTPFDFDLPSIDVQIFMRFIMQHAVVIFFLFSGLGAATGLLLDPVAQDEESDGSSTSDKEAHQYHEERPLHQQRAPLEPITI